LADFETEVATTLERDFIFSDQGQRGVAHQLRPYVKYGYIQDVDQDDLPSFDGVDFIGERNAISYGIDNYLNTFADKEDGEAGGYDYAYLKILQSYDLRDSASDQPFSDIYTQIGWKPVKRAKLYYKNFYDVYDNTFTSHTLESEYVNARGDYFSLDYSYKPDESIEQINAEVKARVFSRWIAGGEIKYSISNERTDEAAVSLTYQALCWSIDFETQYSPYDTVFLVMFNLANIGVPLGVTF
jgi:LPS-assembly protein